VAVVGMFWFLAAFFGTLTQSTQLAGGLSVAASAVLYCLVEVVAAGISERSTESIVASTGGPLTAGRYVLWPIVKGVAWVGVTVQRAIAPREPTDPSEELEEEIMSVVSEGEREGAIENDEKRMIESILDLHDADVGKIMTPRTDMVAIEASVTAEEAVAMVNESGFSRLPVYNETRDNIVGVLYAKDLLCRHRDGTPATIGELMRKPYFVPETKMVARLLQEFKSKKVHIAIVLDEYGGTAGLATVEDILEEIVGEITDEYDSSEEPTVHVVGDDVAEIDARMNIDEVNEALHIELPEDGDFETVGGFVSSHLGRIPVKGETFAYDNVQFVVLAAEERRVSRIQLKVDRRLHLNGDADG
jgi:CBS domain containing-hemolysin-like protein